MTKPLYVLLAILLIDAAGIGLIMPILPSLLREVSGGALSSFHYGALVAVYALMQFLCAPVLGALSDRFGRRPVLLVSLAGAAGDYLMLAFAPDLGWLYVGRMLAGVTGANMAVASAYLTDITPDGQRAARFGQMGAAAGIGFIAGPVIGGVLGDMWLRAPFLLAAALNGLNLLMAGLVLPESRKPAAERSARVNLNAFSALRRLGGEPAVLPLAGIFGVVALVSQWPATLWILYGQDRFGWSNGIAGLSLAGYGVCHSLAQALVIAPLVARMGEVRALVFAVICDALGLALLCIASAGWAPFALLPLFAFGGIAMPALQAMLTREVDESRQGELQGTLASVTNLLGVAGPLIVTGVYAASREIHPGIVWAVGAAAYLLVPPLLLGYRKAGARARLREAR
ncbi:Tet(A)/Tet(B)/Tet(C) family tetracycline efflux MFS transporter [Pandoraea nosoerga]|uniref:Tetracycline resistance MFS efflux pump n=1 Tax=Pandoraea nosoerga TaxID=2508296 RepID=A0A5E4REI0_9BURK|nr:Tet(A)/Tet(B)/Tet(C) family tetracycline efflux MFS transporter [Pandoraea nosoerga]MBN4666731.1 Tet(A)/Tet(B)/Tet(C) family tetracycline efflux MFS transporter [Pandoraea nosoerga]MBN4676879.1 Tet(A)/Tet(B)/Tet(C) family tetracycline efflux MFS transporter [Pandoraea nosoerga]MBN4681514.1 Tet(A)/Tet(B)/Tet(C) family tetracycline efflux MFS transporter [Pandoraea nosoerga]MBN4745998.1 Tet(A)/Tet(B)/Tet(C) family tetracycline efflux MFS transporter [Pandoraea nosoerga]VVD60914.1 tetracycline